MWKKTIVKQTHKEYLVIDENLKGLFSRKGILLTITFVYTDSSYGD